MTSVAANMLRKYPQFSARRDTLELTGVFTIGAAGAVNASPDTDDPEVTLTLNGAGTYDLVYPDAVKAHILVSIQSAGLTVVGYAFTAKAATSGTATFKTVNGSGAATNPASGDILTVFMKLETRG